MRLIDADALIEEALTEGAYGYVDALQIANAPTVDAVPVVRCKDCKWFANNNGGEWFGCWLFNAIKAVPEDAPTPDDFCSYADRKDDNAT